MYTKSQVSGIFRLRVLYFWLYLLYLLTILFLFINYNNQLSKFQQLNRELIFCFTHQPIITNINFKIWFVILYFRTCCILLILTEWLKLLESNIIVQISEVFRYTSSWYARSNLKFAISNNFLKTFLYILVRIKIYTVFIYF